MSIESLVKDELSGSIAKSYVAQISRFHRIQASPMFHEAALYVLEELRRIGLDSAEILQFPADGRRRFWMHRSTLGWEVRSAELRMLEPKERLLASFEDIPMSLHTFSQGTPKEGVTAEVVDVGIGTSAKDYRNKRVKGKIVLARGSARTVHREAVIKRGAIGVITDALSYEFPMVRETVDVPDANAYQGIWPTSDDAKKVRFGFSITKRQGDEIRGYLARGKKVKVLARVDARLFPGTYDVVTASINGSSKPDEEVFLIAHLCHPKPGANDNASGSGTILEIARTMMALISSGKMKRPARTIRFFWVPETTGTVALLSTRPEMRRRLIAGLNLDMVGEDQEACGSTLMVSVTPDSLPSYLGDLAMSVVEASMKELDPAVRIGLASRFRFVRSTFGPGSDHSEFVDATVRIPCVSFTQWPDKFYHTSMDTIERVSVDSLRRVGWIGTVLALKLANADTDTAFQLAGLVCSRGMARIAEAGGKACQEILGMLESEGVKDKVTDLGRLVHRHKSAIEHIVLREREAVRSVLRLGRSRELEAFVDERTRYLADAGVKELMMVDEAAAVVAKRFGIEPRPSIRETKAETESKLLVPKRRFKGTLDWSHLQDFLGEEGFAAYREIEEADPAFLAKTAEILNFVDGRRTVYEISSAVSAEYGPTDVRHVLRYLRDLQRMRLISITGNKRG